MENNKAMKAGIGYTIGNILIKGINFLTLPLFSRLMSPSEFGVFNLFISYDAIISILISLAMHTSLRNAKYKFENKIDNYISSISILYFINSLILLFLILIFRNSISNITGFNLPVLILLIVNGFGSAIFSLYNAKLSLEYSYKKYLILAGLNSIGNIILSLLLITTVFNYDKSIGRITGVSAVIFILSISILYIQYKKSKPVFNKEYWKFSLSYSLPLVPHGISQTLLSQFDKMMIASLVNNVATGIYSLASNVRLIYTVIIDSISNVWWTWFYEQMNDKLNNKEEKLQKGSIALSLLFMIPTIGGLALSREIILILGGKEYIDASYLVVPMVVDAFVVFLYTLVVSSEYYLKKTFYVSLGTLIAAIINCITNVIFIKMFGYIAAAYTTLFSYLIYLIIHIIISRRLIKFYILPLKYIIIELVILFGIGAVCIIYNSNLIIRVILLLITESIAIYYLFKKNKSLISDFINRNKRSE